MPTNPKDIKLDIFNRPNKLEIEVKEDDAGPANSKIAIFTNPDLARRNPDEENIQVDPASLAAKRPVRTMHS